MGFKRQNQFRSTSQSHQKSTCLQKVGTKPLPLAALSLVLIFSVFSGCQSKKVAGQVEASDLNLPSGYTPPVVEQITSSGKNSRPEPSKDGKRLVFVSAKRPNHENSQAYMLDFESLQEKRVTFQDGEVASIVFSPDNSHIIYSSSTDEIKEDSMFIKESLIKMAGETKAEPVTAVSFWKNQPLELYSSFLNGTRIERLTKSPKFDSDPDVHPLGKKILFASARGKHVDLHLVSMNGTYLKPLTDNNAIEAEAKFSPDGEKIVWVEYQKDMKESQIVLADKDGKVVQRLTSAPYIHWNPHWMPDGKSILFSSNRAGNKNYEIYRMRIEDACLQRLTWHSGNDTEPSPTPDGEAFFFTSDRSGTNQIYKSNIKPAEKCKS